MRLLRIVMMNKNLLITRDTVAIIMINDDKKVIKRDKNIIEPININHPLQHIIDEYKLTADEIAELEGVVDNLPFGCWGIMLNTGKRMIISKLNPQQKQKDRLEKLKLIKTLSHLLNNEQL